MVEAIGRPPAVTGRQLLAEVHAQPGPVVSSREIANELDLSYQLISHHLENLVDEGYLISKSVGRSKLYYESDEGQDLIKNEIGGGRSIRRPIVDLVPGPITIYTAVAILGGLVGIVYHNHPILRGSAWAFAAASFAYQLFIEDAEGGSR